MNKKLIRYLLPALLVIALLSVYLMKKSEKKPITQLPVYSPKNQSKTNTPEHTIKDFHFTNQFNEAISLKTIEDKIVVCDFFFSTCQSICPIMSSQMLRVQEAFKNDTNILILSHTVDPEEDDVSVLLKYAMKNKAMKNKWHFLTGNKKELYQQARESYLLDNEQGNGDEHDFIHTDKFALVDWKGRIRGYYVGTDSIEVTKLIGDVKILMDEKNWESTQN